MNSALPTDSTASTDALASSGGASPAPAMAPGRRLSLLRDASIAAACGLCLAMSVLAGPNPACAFAYAAALILACGTRPSLRRVFFVGWVAGFVANGFIFYWIVELLVAFAHFPYVGAVPVAALLWAAQGLPIAFACWLGEGIARRGAPRHFIMPAALAVTSALAPSLFPWHPSTSLVHWTAYAQVAEFGGAPLLDALVFFAGGALASLVLRSVQPATGPRLGLVVLLSVLLCAPAAYGFLRMPSLEQARESAPTLRVGLVQPNVSIQDKHNPAFRASRLRDLRQLNRSLRLERADIIVWPETAYPYPLSRGIRREPPSTGRIAAGIPLLAGALTQESRCGRYNSTVAFDAQGFVRGVSDKVELLHFGETVPLWHWLPPLQDYFPCPGLAAGEAPMVLTLDGVRFGPLNCYEDVLSEPARAFGGQAELLVNLTNDAWFGDTAEPHLHHLASRLRTIENRRDLVRSVNTGVSGHIDHLGREVSRTSTFVRTTMIAEAKLFRITTPWQHFGDQTTPLLWLYLLLMTVRFRARFRRLATSGH